MYNHRVSTGTQIWPENDKFSGDFVSNYRHGQGRYYWANGEVIIPCRRVILRYFACNVTTALLILSGL